MKRSKETDMAGKYPALENYLCDLPKSQSSDLGKRECAGFMKTINSSILLDPSAELIIAYLDGLCSDGRLRQGKVNARCGSYSPLRYASGMPRNPRAGRSCSR